MKITNIENGKKKIYIQKSDILMLKHTDEAIPATIFEKIYTDAIFVYEDNKDDFIEFTNPNDIEFFKSLDWIIDFREFKDKTEEEIKAKGQEIINEMNRIASRYNSIANKDSLNNRILRERYYLLDYKFKSLADILWIKEGLKEVPFPLVKDSEGFIFNGGEGINYELKASLNPNKLLVYRKDGEKIYSEQTIPKGFFQMGMSIAILERNEKKAFFSNYEMKSYLDADNKYLIVEFKPRTYTKENTKKENKGIKTWLKKKLKKNELQAS